MRAFLQSLARTVRWHRRGLAAVAAAIAVLSALTVLRPAPPPSRQVVVAVTTVPAGTSLTPDHVALRNLPEVALPRGALAALDLAVGRTVATDLPPGLVLTPEALADPGRRLAEGQVLVPFRLDDPAITALVRVGDLVSVVAEGDQGQPVVVARRVRVAALPRPPDEPGPFGGGSDPGGLVLVQTDTATGAALAVAARAGALGVMLG